MLPIWEEGERKEGEVFLVWVGFWFSVGFVVVVGGFYFFFVRDLLCKPCEVLTPHNI